MTAIQEFLDAYKQRFEVPGRGVCGPVDEEYAAALAEYTGPRTATQVMEARLQGRQALLRMPAHLNGSTCDLVVRFAEALAAKLRKAEVKHGYKDHWANPANVEAIRADLHGHIRKGDPLDAAAYCAFLWHHGASTIGVEALRMPYHENKVKP